MASWNRRSSRAVDASTASVCDQAGNGGNGYLTGDVDEALPAVGLDADDLGDTGEARRPDVSQQCMDGLAVRARRAQHVLADAHHVAGVGHPSRQRLTVVHTSIFRVHLTSS